MAKRFVFLPNILNTSFSLVGRDVLPADSDLTTLIRGGPNVRLETKIKHAQAETKNNYEKKKK
jgi:hypothetical protein